MNRNKFQISNIKLLAFHHLRLINISKGVMRIVPKCEFTILPYSVPTINCIYFYKHITKFQESHNIHIFLQFKTMKRPA